MPQDEQGQEVTERGIRLYGETTCTYGTKVQVYESSAASGPHVWLNLEPNREVLRPRPDGSVSAHLSVAQAWEVVRALQAHLDEIPTRWENGEKWLEDADAE